MNLTQGKDHDLFCPKCGFHVSVFPVANPTSQALAEAKLTKMHRHCKGELKILPIGSIR